METLPVSPPKVAIRPHWIVRTNYFLRTAAFAVTFVSLAFELWRSAGVLMWLLMSLQFLVYPHCLYWWASRASNTQQAEITNLLLDAILIGVWTAALHFPLWPTFTLGLGCLLNNTICNGTKGVVGAVVALVMGAVAGCLLFGFRFAPETGWPTIVILIVGMSAYLIAIGHASHTRNLQLRKTREKLRMGEQALRSSNETLEQQLAEIQNLQAQLKEQTIRDPLTGLFNRRYLDTVATPALARCAHDQTSLCLMMIDIDHFKAVNDTYGHQCGDEVLKKLARLLIDGVRSSDVASRFGGEEFLMVMPNMPAGTAVARAERWRADFAALTMECNQSPFHATLSAGIAVFPYHGQTIDELTRCADVALYRAKANGRNRIELFEQEMEILA